MLELIDLYKRFGAKQALAGCSFEVAPGRIVGFLGPNGAGKTTSMRSIFGLVVPDRGEVLWKGRPINHARRQAFGYMPEERGLYPRMRAQEQIAYFGRLHGLDRPSAGKNAWRWLEELGLSDRAQSRVEELSHGNQQRIQLAIALVGEPELLVLDEPFAGLDPLGVATLGEVIREQARQGAAVVFSSHQLDLVEDICDDIAIIDSGRIVLSGALSELRRTSHSRYVQVQVDNGAGDSPLSGWVSRMPDASLLWARNGEVRFRVSSKHDPQELLAEASGLGEVAYFRFEPPALSDLFSEALER